MPLAPGKDRGSLLDELRRVEEGLKAKQDELDRRESVLRGLEEKMAKLEEDLRRAPLDHVGIAVTDATAAAKVYAALGLRATRTEEVPAEGVRTVFLGEGAPHLELVQPLGPDTVVARFLATRGPGIHHLALAVEDLRKALGEARAAGLEVVGEAPRRGARGRLVAFLHPRSTHGVLLELVENPR
jgi:methylmalonyl-CoA epimerase